MGATTRKPTSVLASETFAKALQRTIGAIPLAAGKLTENSIVGVDNNGKFKSIGSEVYSAEFAMRLSIALMGSMPDFMILLSEYHVSVAIRVGTDDIFPMGSVIELYWHLDQVWYAGIVLDTRVRKGMVHGRCKRTGVLAFTLTNSVDGQLLIHVPFALMSSSQHSPSFTESLQCFFPTFLVGSIRLSSDLPSGLFEGRPTTTSDVTPRLSMSMRCSVW